jgi:site-specific DNA-methyltransferase (adenine-specific)
MEVEKMLNNAHNQLLNITDLIGNALFQGDCLDIMPFIPDKSVDAIIADLPYGTTACKWDSVLPLNKLWLEYERIIKNNGAIILFSSQPFTTDLINSNRKLFRYELIWQKNTGGGFATCKIQPMKRHENILVFYKNKPIFNPIFQEYSNSTKKRFKDGEMVNRRKQLEKSTNKINGGLSFAGEQGIEIKRGKYPESVQFFKSVANYNKNRLHPTQKPVTLLEYLVKTYTNENDIVLDNCMGSGTTGVACKNLNRKFIGIEKDENYFKIAEQRINAPSLF